MPQHHMVIPHYMGKSKELEVESKNVEEGHSKSLKRQDSFSSRSSLQDIPLLLPQEPDSVDASPEGSPKSSCLDHDIRLIDQPSRVGRNHHFLLRKSKYEDVVDTPMKGFVDDLDNDFPKKPCPPFVLTSDPEWWETQERGDQMAPADETGQVGPCAPCRCQVGHVS